MNAHCQCRHEIGAYEDQAEGVGEQPPSHLQTALEGTVVGQDHHPVVRAGRIVAQSHRNTSTGAAKRTCGAEDDTSDTRVHTRAGKLLR